MFSLNSVPFIIPRQSLEETNLCKETSINGLLEDSDNISRDPLQLPEEGGKQPPPQTREPPAGSRPREKKRLSHLSRISWPDTTADYASEKAREKSLYGDDLERFIKAATFARQNGHVLKMHTWGGLLSWDAAFVVWQSPVSADYHWWHLTHWANPAKKVTSSGASRRARQLPSGLISI